MNQPAPIIEENTTDKTQSRSPFRKWAVLASIVFHVALLIVLLVWRMSQPKLSTPVADNRQTVSRSDAPKATERLRAEPVAEVPPEQIEKSLESQIQQVERLTDERKLSELDKNLSRLESVADPQSVQEVTATIASTMGLDTQQYAPKETPASGSFDTDSSQLQEVTRKRDDSGNWQYESLLVDAQGRTMTVPMSSAEGETVYNAFESMKKFPMAEGIYRGIVMPLLQQMVKAQELAEKAANEAGKMQALEQASETNPSETQPLGVR